MDAGPGGALGIFPVEMVRKRNVSRVHFGAPKTLFEVGVGEASFHLVASAELLEFLRVSGDEGDQLGILRVGKGGENGDLSDVTQADHGVAYFSLISAFRVRHVQVKG
jgi:hypothetical protein